MSQQKKSLYNLYPRVIDFMAAKIRPVLSKKDRTKKINEIIHDVIEYMPMMTKSLDFLIMCEEYYWSRMGNEVIFPESEVVLDNFAKARFSLETSQGFDLPFPSFVLAMPHGYTFMGTELPSLLVTIMDYHSSPETIIQPFCKWIKLSKPMNVGTEQDDPPGTRAISISYRDPKTNAGYVRMLVSERKIPALLNAESLDHFKNIMGHYGEMVGVIDLDEFDLDIQFKAIKLIAALGVYNLATEGQRLKPGFPGQSVPKMVGRNPDITLKMNTLSSKLPSQLQRSTPEAHYRTWYIRQLRDERYYKGEYASYPKGSRFVFVSDAVVGSKVNPNTQI